MMNLFEINDSQIVTMTETDRARVGKSAVAVFKITSFTHTVVHTLPYTWQEKCERFW